MRMLMISAMIALSGCATAVNDSLDRRGLDARTLLAERVTTARDDATKAGSAFGKAAEALSAIEGLDGAALARGLDQARAAGQDAALAAQDMRLSADTAQAAAARFFQKKDEELALMKTSEESLRAAEAELASLDKSHRAFAAAFNAAKWRLSPALSLYDAEVTALRKNATSRIAADARAGERASAVKAANEAGAALAAAAKEADRYLEALK